MITEIITYSCSVIWMIVSARELILSLCEIRITLLSRAIFRICSNRRASSS